MLDYLDVLMFAGLCLAILLGYPVTFTLIGIALLFALIGWSTGHFDTGLLGALSQRIYGIMTNPVLIAIPVFVFMGAVLEKSRIAEDLLEQMGRLFGSVRGGLAVSVVVVGALLAASTGIVGATVVAMGLIALPTMLANGYDKRLAAGTVCTAGTLGQIIPPSTLLIILSDVMSNAYQQAQFAEGKFTVETISVGQTFAAALVPGLVLVALYIAYIMVTAYLRPAMAPALRRVDDASDGKGGVMSVLIPPVVLIIAVLGSILGGIATPTEAASVGAIGAVLLAALRLGDARTRKLVLIGGGALAILAVLAGVAPVRLQRGDLDGGDYLIGAIGIVLTLVVLLALIKAFRTTGKAGILKDAATGTMTVSAMIFGTIIGANVFSLVFRGLGGDARIEEILTLMPGGADGALIFVMILVFVLGFFLDFVEISVILLPIVAPALILMGHDPVWLSVLIAINLQTSFLTPPFGFSLFYLRGAAPPEVTTGIIYAGVLPFIGLQALGVAAVWMLPGLATALPAWLF
ncbi:MAG: TRAP transporter large permease subunit [Alphaproteobacteria bacterium]|nr:TRAP transporter large permease subunit [Alphaproteobacteria bacterium]